MWWLLLVPLGVFGFFLALHRYVVQSIRRLEAESELPSLEWHREEKEKAS